MHSSTLLALLVAAPVAGGCDAYGGSMTDLGGGGSDSFVIESRYPAPGSSGVAVGTFVEVGFNEVIDTTSVDDASLGLLESSFGTVTVDGKKLRLTPGGDLTPGTSYTIKVSADVRGTNGHLLGSNPTWGFKTAGATPDTTPPLGPRPR